MNRRATRPSSVLQKVAAAMHQMGIVGLPRNYELVYEAMSGTRPELTRDFLALGNNRSQAALDELGRKYLPHHHEHEVLTRSSATVRAELESFMRLVRHETSSLRYYGNLLDETSRMLTSTRMPEPALVGSAVKTIAAATAQKVSDGQNIADEAAQQSSRLDRVAGELHAFEARKDIDTLTGLANARAFKRKLVELYGAPDGPRLSGVAICDIDNFAAVNERYDATIGDKFIRHVARIVERHLDGSVIAAHLGGGQFGFIFGNAPQERVVGFADRIRATVAKTPLINALNDVSLGRITLSFGVCMSGQAQDAAAIVENALEATRAAKAMGRNRIEIHRPAPPRTGTDWMLYRA